MNPEVSGASDGPAGDAPLPGLRFPPGVPVLTLGAAACPAWAWWRGLSTPEVDFAVGGGEFLGRGVLGEELRIKTQENLGIGVATWSLLTSRDAWKSRTEASIWGLIVLFHWQSDACLR